MKFFKIFLWIATGVAVLLSAAIYFPAIGKSRPLETVVIESKGGVKHGFSVEIADTPEKQESGLMFRERMAPDHGMLFEFARADILRFWMKNTLIPLDMLFIAPDGEIKTIHANAVPGDLTGLSSEVPCNGVLEINGGLAKELGIAAGDRVVHRFFKTSTR
jgi:uncharacterized membrane protein (UPF0127 family)